MQFNLESGEALSNAIDTIDNALAATEDAQKVVTNLLGAAPTWETYMPYAEYYCATYSNKRGVAIESARKKWLRTIRAVGITVPKPPQATTKEAVKKQQQRAAKRDTPAQRAIDAIKAKEKARVAAEAKELTRLRDVCIHAVKVAFEAKDKARLKAMAKSLGKPVAPKVKKTSKAAAKAVEQWAGKPGLAVVAK